MMPPRQKWTDSKKLSGGGRCLHVERERYRAFSSEAPDREQGTRIVECGSPELGVARQIDA
jgi:hypothetical protein